jgi:hypothetical protein
VLAAMEECGLGLLSTRLGCGIWPSLCGQAHGKLINHEDTKAGYDEFDLMVYEHG